MPLSPKALKLLQVLFSEQSNLQLPVGVAETIIEIKQWVAEQLEPPKNKD